MTDQRHFMHALVAVAISGLAFASGYAVAGNHQPATIAADATALTEAEVRKVDMDTKKITLRHGPIVNLGMPAMTMVFQVRDPAVLEQVKAGDQVLFTADKTEGAYVITQIRKKN